MSLKNTSFTPDLSADDPRLAMADYACFYGLLLAVLAYGALLMLYIQLAGVLIARPGRGRIFWLVFAYSVFLFPLATLIIGAIFKFSQKSLIDNRPNNGSDPFLFYEVHNANYVNVLGEGSNALFALLADILMLARLWVIWNCSMLVMVIPFLLYVAKSAVSIPMIIAAARAVSSPMWTLDISTSYHSVTLAFNVYMTCMICLRLRMLRPKLEDVSGKLHASFYTSIITIFVESGGFFTIWETVFLILRSRGSLFQWVFFFSIPFNQGVTRMLIILRIAQCRAWSRDLVESIHRGVLDWQISSTHSIPLHDIPSISDFSHGCQQLRKIQEDSDLMA